MISCDNRNLRVDCLPQLGCYGKRAHKTHGNPVLVDALKKLGLEGRLKFNREIELKNEDRRLKSINYAMGNASRPGSPTASFVTVDSEEIDLIRKEMAFLKRVFEYLGPWAINFIQGRNSSDKRKMEEDAESKVVTAKRARLVPDVEEGTNDPTVISEIIFPQILFDTAKRVSGGIPLSFFTYEHLSTIASDTLSTQKFARFFLGRRWKEVHGKLIEEWKLPKGGDKKEGLSYSEFREAAGFLLKFEAERTIGGENSNNYRWLDNHFSFWLVHRNSESLFELWKELEFNQRMESELTVDRCGCRDMEILLPNPTHLVEEHVDEWKKCTGCKEEIGLTYKQSAQPGMRKILVSLIRGDIPPPGVTSQV
ncbi:hypothetical protein F5890DRAFT_1588996 [Lentinula detonsa]|uniref:Uncharacterized protein n=1 Tax=Lentinula detonsa TaxID=2804962 RepID=A0AA38PQP8_9AGAR|nr:hypothetical protein F5890DRAFT_1588996 [Lentinula detonsa]